MRTRLRKKSSDRNSASTKAEQDQRPVRSFGDSSQSNEEVSSASSEKSIGYNFGQIEVQPATPRVIQPQLSIGRTNNKYEQEADLVANHVVKRIHPSVQPSTKLLPIQRMENPVIQRQPPYDGNDKPTGLVMKDYMKTKCTVSPKAMINNMFEFYNAHKTNNWNNPKVFAAVIESVGQVFALTQTKAKNPLVKFGLKAGYLASTVAADQIRAYQDQKFLNHFTPNKSIKFSDFSENKSHFLKYDEVFRPLDKDNELLRQIKMQNFMENSFYLEVLEKLQEQNIIDEIKSAFLLEHHETNQFLNNLNKQN